MCPRLSGGTDHLVNLWRIASCSSAPWLGSEEGEGNEASDPPDIRVRARERRTVLNLGVKGLHLPGHNVCVR